MSTDIFLSIAFIIFLLQNFTVCNYSHNLATKIQNKRNYGIHVIEKAKTVGM
jgi:hypothetical protein